MARLAPVVLIGAALLGFAEPLAAQCLPTRIEGPTPQIVGGFGSAVSLWGDTALIGEPDLGLSTLGGQAHIFRRRGHHWVSEQILANSAEGSSFGTSVAIGGDLAVV